MKDAPAGPGKAPGNRKKAKSAKQKAKKQQKKEKKFEDKLEKGRGNFLPAHQGGSGRGTGGKGAGGQPGLTKAEEEERETVQWNFTYQTTKRDKDIRDRTASVRGAMKGPGGKK